MLDQNTDRMWFVIGALVVGAGIILIVNKTMPEVFANVADAFKGVADESTKSASKLKVHQGNLINAADAMRVWSVKTNTNAWGAEFVRTTNLAPIIDAYDINQRYTLRFDIKSLDTSEFDTIFVYSQNDRSAKYELRVDGNGSSSVKVTEDWQTITIKDVYFRPSRTYNETNDSYLSFYGKYKTGNSPIIKNLHLSLQD